MSETGTDRLPGDPPAEASGDEARTPPRSFDQTPEPSADAFALWRDMERRRIEACDRRTAAMERAASANDEQHRREAELRGQRLEFEKEAAERRHALAMRLFVYGGGFAAAFLVVAFGFVLFGADAQSQFSKDLLKSIAIALAGGGAFHLLAQAARWLLGR